MQSFFDQFSRCLTTVPAFSTFNSRGKGGLFFLYPYLQFQIKAATDDSVALTAKIHISGEQICRLLSLDGFILPAHKNCSAKDILLAPSIIICQSACKINQVAASILSSINLYLIVLNIIIILCLKAIRSESGKY